MPFTYTVVEKLDAGFVVILTDTGFRVRVYSEEWRIGSAQERVDGGTVSPALAGKTIYLGVAETVFDWPSFQAKEEVVDYSCIVFPLYQDGVGAPYNRLVDTYLSKRTGYDEFVRTRVHTAFHLYVPGKQSAFNDCALHAFVGSNYPLVVINGTAMQQDAQTVWASTLPALRMSGPSSVAPEGYAEVQIEAVGADGTRLTAVSDTVYLEEVYGYLPKRRVSLTNGVGTFKAGALGLAASDVVRVKAGYRYFTGLADISIPVGA